MQGWSKYFTESLHKAGSALVRQMRPQASDLGEISQQKYEKIAPLPKGQLKVERACRRGNNAHTHRRSPLSKHQSNVPHTSCNAFPKVIPMMEELTCTQDHFQTQLMVSQHPQKT